MLLAMIFQIKYVVGNVMAWNKKVPKVATLFLNSEPANEANLIANKDVSVITKNNAEGR